jgi:hypothetical protein
MSNSVFDEMVRECALALKSNTEVIQMVKVNSLTNCKSYIGWHFRNIALASFCNRLEHSVSTKDKQLEDELCALVKKHGDRLEVEITTQALGVAFAG